MSTGSEFRLRPRLIPAFAALVQGAVFVHLGVWQAGKAEVRAAQKLRHEERAHLPPQAIGAPLVQPEEVLDARVSVEGQYEPADQFFVDNRQQGGRPGLHVITPLKIKDSPTRILINRGWIGWSDRRAPLPVVPVPEGTVRITGMASVPLVKKPLLISQQQEMPSLWFAPDIERYRQQHAYAVQPILILQEAHDSTDGLTRHWPPPEDRAAMHRGYAFQWFAMAGVLLVFFLWTSVRRQSAPSREC